MIIYLLLALITGMISALFAFLPLVTELPSVAGVSLDHWFGTMVGWYNQFAVDNWIVTFPMQCFMGFFAFELIYLGVKLFLGSRTPAKNQ